MWLCMWACTPDPKGVELAIELTQPSEAAPLVRRLRTEANVPVTVNAEWASDDHSASATFAAGPEVQEHLLLGMRPGRTYTLTVSATSQGGEVATEGDVFTTVAVGAHFPQAEVIAGSGDRQPGDTLLPMHSFINNTEPNDLAAVFDESGQLIYWLEPGDFVYDVEVVDGGLLALVGEGLSRLIRYDWSGEIVGSWSNAAESGAETLVPTQETAVFHHDMGASRFVDDQYLGVGRRAETVAQYPTSYTDPNLVAPAEVAVDTVLEFDAAGTLLSEVSLDEILPIAHIGYDSLSTTIEGWADWAHANAIIEDADGNWIISLRHLDVIVKLDRDTDQVMWMLGNHENWPVEFQAKLLEPVGEVQWQYHQHGPELAPPGPNGEVEIVVFDNANYGASPYTGEMPNAKPFSRVVQFEVDEQAMTVRELWSFDSPQGGRLYSEAVGNADHLANGNVLSAWGFLAELPDGTLNSAAGLGLRSVRVIEIDPVAETEVETLHLSTPIGANDKGWTGYRAERIPDLEGRVVD
jgi:arylsulfate sulfotransferase